MNKEYFNSDEAATYLGITIDTLKYHLYKSKRLTAIKLHPRALLFTRAELNRFQETNRPPGRPRKQS